MHVTGNGLFSQSKGRPTKSDSRQKLQCSQILNEKILELRKDFALHDDTKMLVMLSISTNDMNRYVSMYPEVWFIDCTSGETEYLKCYIYYRVYNLVYTISYIVVSHSIQNGTSEIVHTTSYIQFSIFMYRIHLY